MRMLTIVVPAVARTAHAGDLEVLVRDWGDEGQNHIAADVRPRPGGIWTPVKITEETT